MVFITTKILFVCFIFILSMACDDFTGLKLTEFVLVYTRVLKTC